MKFIVTNPQPPILVLRHNEIYNVAGNNVCRSVCVRRIYFFWPLLSSWNVIFLRMRIMQIRGGSMQLMKIQLFVLTSWIQMNYMMQLYYLKCDCPFAISQRPMQEIQITHIKRLLSGDTLNFFQDPIHPNKCIVITFHDICSSHVLNLHEETMDFVLERTQRPAPRRIETYRGREWH